MSLVPDGMLAYIANQSSFTVSVIGGCLPPAASATAAATFYVVRPPRPRPSPFPSLNYPWP